ncbi:MAG: CBS domain-containing protein [Alphaproteobacteria bacterium]|nr:CBS domain-containing protein [Alphaproteobacteria bacterium]
MGALAASTFHAPLAMLLVLFELTGDFTVVPTMAVASAMAMLVSSTSARDRCTTRSSNSAAYTWIGESPPGSARPPREGSPTARIVTVATDASLHDVVAAFRGTRDNLVWLVDADGRCAGAIHVQDALDALAAGSGAPPVTVVPPVSEETPAAEALHLLAGDHEEVPVLDRDGRLVGVLHERVLLELVET